MLLTSSKNPRLGWVRRLAADRKARREEGLWVAEGLRLAEEVWAEEAAVRLWVLEEGWGEGSGRSRDLRSRIEGRGDDLLEVRRGLLREVADTETPQGVVVVFEAPRWTVRDLLGRQGPVVVLDRIQDPGNLGTLARTAEGAGVSGLVLVPGTVDPGSPKALRASSGSLLRVPFLEVEDPVAFLREAGVPVLATAGGDGVPYDRADLAGRFALVLGQEGAGLSAELLREAGEVLRVPMEGRLESLNVAATAAVILFEAARQRRERG